MQFNKENLMILLPILYAIGFLIHNFYLSSFNSFEFEIIQARYIFTGTLFSLIAASYVVILFIDLDISYLPNNIKWKKSLPLILRFSSLPAITIMFLDRSGALMDINVKSQDFDAVLVAAYVGIGSFIILFNVVDMVFMLSKGNGFPARILRFLSYSLAVPMLVLVVYLSQSNLDIKNLLLFSFFIAACIFGYALQQADRKHGVEPDYVAPESKEEDKAYIHIATGLIGLAVVLWNVVSIYSEAIYSKVPVALGGAKPQAAILHKSNSMTEVKVIQETSDWFLVKGIKNN